MEAADGLPVPGAWQFFIKYFISYVESSGLLRLERPLLKIVTMQYVKKFWGIPGARQRRARIAEFSISLDLKRR